MKKLILLALSFLWIIGQALSQNPYWAFPPKYVDFSSGGTVNNIGGGTISKSGVANAIFSVNGTLQIFGTNYRYYNRTDGQINSLFPHSLGSDLAFAPDPEYINSYIVMGNSLITGNLCGTCPSDFGVFYYRVRFNGTSGMCIDNLNTSPYNVFSTINYGMGMAVPASNNISSATPSPYLYLVNIDWNGTSTCPIQLASFYGQSNSKNVTVSTIGALPTIIGTRYDVKEATLSPDGTKLAFIVDDKNIIYYINNVNNCAGGTCTSSNVTQITVSSATEVNGVEFSPDGTKLFYTKSTPNPTVTNQISYYTLATSTHTDVLSSTNLGGSQIKRAIDGYMYVSNGSILKGFNLSSSPYTVTKTISSVPNTSQAFGIYTLPDQINGMDYATAEGCVSGNVSYTASPVPSIKVSGSITASNTAGVTSSQKVIWAAGSSITLSPNFSVATGGIFSASISPCSGTRSVLSCTSTVYRKETDDKDITNESIYKVHPNPISEGQLNFGRSVSTFILTNSTGEVVKRGSNTDKLEVKDLSKGMYILKLDDQVEKIIIQ